jgi:Cell division protein ZapA
MIPLNIAIGDRTYRIKVEPTDEERVRKTVKVINDKIMEFKTNFAGKDMQDYIAMVLVWYATREEETMEQDASLAGLSEYLSKAEELLDKSI